MQPLKNINVLIPRPIDSSDEFSEKLVELGANPIIFPLIKVEAVNKKLLKSTYQADQFNWIIFTSTVAVRFFFDVIKSEEVSAKIAVVGTATKREIEKLGLKADFIPSAATAKKLVKEIPLNKGENVFIPRSKIAGNAIIETLEKREVKVTALATYDNTPVVYSKEEVEAVFEKGIDVISFTSGSTVNNFVALLGGYKIKLGGQKLVSIGPSTTSAAKKLDVEIDATAEFHNVIGLVDTILELYNKD